MRYYGSKIKLLNFIDDAVNKTELNHGSKFVDLFAGTNVVGKHFKKRGYTVISNDILEFSHALSKAYIELNDEPRFLGLKKIFPSKDINKEYVIGYLNSLKPKKSFIFNNYCPGGKGKRKYFSNDNGKKIDSIRSQINAWKEEGVVTELEYYYLLASLIEAVNLVSNVAGTYGAYLKKWDKRALKNLILTPPEVIKSERKNIAYKKDANELIKKINPDILYLDPPYNGRQYASNYFLLELIAEGWFDKKPEIYGDTGMRKYEEQSSLYSVKSKATEVFEDLINKSKAKYILLSYNNEGVIPDKEIKRILTGKGNLQIIEKDHKRYKSINQTHKDPTKTKERIFYVETPNALKRANKLDGKTWLQNSFSIWKDLSKNLEEKKINHPAMFPIQLAERCIDLYTNGSGKNVLDCFAGSGSTLIAGLKKKMNVYGFDITKEFKELFNQRLKNSYQEYKKNGQINYYIKDAKFINKILDKNTVDLCITSPPYWDILNERRSADQKKGRNYSDKNSDIGNIDDYHIFLNELAEIIQSVFDVMKNNGYFIMNVMDLRKKDKFYQFHCDVSAIMKEAGFTLEDIVIWDRQKEYNNCKPLGYPYKFIVNKVHEYILIYKKYG